MPTIMADELREICKKILVKLGVPENDAFIVADSTVKADLRGVSSHGIFRFPSYIPRIQKGLINLNPKIKAIVEGNSYVLLDGDNGLGQAIGVKASELAVKKAKESGIGFILIRNTNYMGMMAYYTLKIVEHEMIGLATCNAPAFMAPWGGRERKLGTNPLSIAAPIGKEFPFVLDMATTATSVGKIRVAAQKEEKIPEGWALDAEGRPTTDPNEALKGVLLPMGGPKGYGLALAIDIVCGVLSGASFGSKLPHPIFDLTTFPNLGAVIAAININSFMRLEEYYRRVKELIDDIKSCKPAQGFSEVLIPGELEYRVEQERLKNGIPVLEETWKELQKLLNTL